MESKLSIAVLCFLGLFVVAQSYKVSPAKWILLQNCYTYSNCQTDDGAKKIDDCVSILKPDEQDSLFKAVQDNYPFQAKDAYGLLPAYCKLDDADKPSAYAGIVKGIAQYQKEACSDGSRKDECDRQKQNIDCFFGYLDGLQQQGKC